jgi:hypothetical protein
MLPDLPHGASEQAAAAGSLAEHVAEQVERVHAHQHRLLGIDLPFTKGDMLLPARLVEGRTWRSSPPPQQLSNLGLAVCSISRSLRSGRR